MAVVGVKVELVRVVGDGKGVPVEQVTMNLEVALAWGCDEEGMEVV